MLISVIVLIVKSLSRGGDDGMVYMMMHADGVCILAALVGEVKEK